MANLELRGTKREEWPEVVRLIEQVFGDLEGEELEESVASGWPGCLLACSETLDTHRIAVKDGVVVSHVDVIIREAKYGAGKFRLGGIGAVCTHPDHRKRGHASALMQHTVEYMTKIGLPFTALTGIHNYYDRFGYTTLWPGSGMSFQMEGFPVEAVRAAAGKITTRALDFERDAASLQRVYEAFWGPHDGFCTRSPDRWNPRDMIPRGAEASPRVAVSETGEVVGYALYSWGCNVAEFAGVDQAAFAALLLAAYENNAAADSEDFNWVTRTGLPDLRWARKLIPLKYHEQTHPAGGWMGRILDLGAFFAAIVPELDRNWRAARIPERGTLQINTGELGSVTLHMEEGVSLPNAAPPITAALTLKVELTHQQIAEIAFGFARPADSLPPGTVRRWLEAIFPARAYSLPRFDWF